MRATRGRIPRRRPFTLSELEEIYPAASARSKVDDAFRERAQDGDPEASERLRALSCHLEAYHERLLSGSKEKLLTTLNVEFRPMEGRERCAALHSRD